MLPRSFLSCLCLVALVSCPSAGDDDDSQPTLEPTPEPTPTLNLSIDVEVVSATEVDLRVRSDVAVAIELEYGVEELTFSRQGETGREFDFYLYGLEPETSYRYQVSVAGEALREGSFETGNPRSGPFRVLFDNAHAQQAGSADWVIDNDAPYPEPDDPRKESDWRGAYSTWGYELYRTGRYILTTWRTAPLTYGERSGDLADVDAVVIPEPNSPFEDSEIDALHTFVEQGGGLFLIANHAGADRNEDGWDSVRVWSEALERFDPPTGLYLDAVNETDSDCSNVFADPLDPVTAGLFGEVERMSFYNATTFHVDPAVNSTVQGVVWVDFEQGQGTERLRAVRLRYGEGRIVALSDSTPADDGTGNDSELHATWSEQDNAAFFMNATAWLVGDAGG